MTAGDRQLIRAKREQAGQLRRPANELSAEANVLEAGSMTPRCSASAPW